MSSYNNGFNRSNNYAMQNYDNKGNDINRINNNSNNNMYFKEDRYYSNNSLIYNNNNNNNNNNNMNNSNYDNNYYNVNYGMVNPYINNMVSPNYYNNDNQYILNKKTARILYIYNMTNEYKDENFIYSLCYIYGDIESVNFMKGKNLFIVKFVSTDSALNAYKNLPTYFNNAQFELRNESKKISYFNDMVNSNKYVSPNLTEKKFLSLSADKRQEIMNIKQKELLRKCNDKLNEYINMYNDKNTNEENKQNLQTLIKHIKARIEMLNNNQCENVYNGINGGGSDNINNMNNINYNNNDGSTYNNYNNFTRNNQNSTTIKINSLNNIRDNEELSKYIINNNSIFLNEHISYFSLFSFGEKYAIIKYNNENIAKMVFENCNMCNINVDFVQDDNDNDQYNENGGMN
ncbi:conserved Plasmodium protein, unknown function [Plasmodium sp. DRC-Itaito]|nr:conserved Plasmodium protein, unknown function [Plasmodium sp. DRC-Itaito]